MANKDYFELYWGKYISWTKFSKMIIDGARPKDIKKIVPISNTSFHVWKRKVLDEHHQMQER